MNKDIERYAANNDITSLRYIFADSLDVDPTFEQYREDYEYCSKLPGFWEMYEERTPLIEEKSRWDEDYWVKIKFDLKKNFAEKRFHHMMEVARVVKADKVAKLRQSRAEQQQKKTEEEREQNIRTESVPSEQSSIPTSTSGLSMAEQQQKEMEEERKRMAQEYQEACAREKEEEEDRKRRQAASSNKRTDSSQVRPSSGDSSPKKSAGIALIIAAVIIIVVLIIILT